MSDAGTTRTWCCTRWRWPSADEELVSFLVHHEATFDRDELRRHLTVVLLTPSRLVIGHTDDYPADEMTGPPHAATSTEAVRIDRLTSVVVSHVVDNPAGYDPGALPREVVITRGLGSDQSPRPRAGQLW